MIDTQVDQGIAVLKMDHGKVNAMSIEFLIELNRQFANLQKDDAVKAVIIAGNDRVFSAGVDLKRVVAESNEYLDRYLPELTAMFLNAFCFPKPLIAAVTGHAVAGGCVLACAADYRVISNDARIGVPELRVGVPFPTEGMEIMRWTATGPAFRQIINTGATFQGEEAVRVGLADQTASGIPTGKVLEAARKAVAPFLVVAPAIFELTKKQMRQPVLDLIANGNECFGKAINDGWRNDDTRNSIASYVAERLS